jgi:hypothetical protein
MTTVMRIVTDLRKIFGSTSAEIPAAVVIIIIIAALTALILATAAHTPRAFLNVTQAIAALFFVIVATHRAGGSTVAIQESDSKPAAGLWLALLIGAATWAVMIPFYFIRDDFEHLGLAQRPMFSSLWALTTRGQLGAFLRPVGFASIFLDYRLYGFWPAGYHATNLIIHLASVAGVYCLAKELRFGSPIASISSLMFAVLPIEVEAVAWMGARFDLLSACFTIWGAVFYVRYRWEGTKSNYVVALFFFFLAVLSKENAFIFPLLLAAAEFLVLPQRRWAPLVGCFLLAISVFVYRWIVLGGIGGYVSAKWPAHGVSCQLQGPARPLSARSGPSATRLQLDSTAAGGNHRPAFIDQRDAPGRSVSVEIGFGRLETPLFFFCMDDPAASAGSSVPADDGGPADLARFILGDAGGGDGPRSSARWHFFHAFPARSHGIPRMSVCRRNAA